MAGGWEARFRLAGIQGRAIRRWMFLAWMPALRPPLQEQSTFWKAKIASNRRRDSRVARKLRRDGWSVLRVWGMQAKRTAHFIPNHACGSIEVKAYLGANPKYRDRAGVLP